MLLIALAAARKIPTKGLWFYPDYGKATCYEKPLSEFDKYDAEKYVTKNSWCMAKFSNNVVTCCDNGGRECKATGTPLYIFPTGQIKSATREIVL
jgi:hypothetical protein